MPVTVELIKDHRVVLQTYSDPLDATQMNDLKNRMQRDILPAAIGKMHVIADFRQVANLPGMLLGSGSRMLMSAHPNTGTIIFVTQNAFVSSMAQIFSRIAARHTFKLAQTLDEALKFADDILAKETSITE